MAYNLNLPADTTAPADIRENFRALKEDKIVAAASATNADTAAKLVNARSISLVGDATGSASFDGVADVAITVNVTKADISAKLENAHTINGVPFDGTSDILISAFVPVGTVIWHAAATPPSGYLECDGSVLLSSTYPELVAVLGTTYGTHGQLPDLRGEFVRGWDHGKGMDSGRTFGSKQLDAFQGHWHNFRYRGSNYGTNGSYTMADFNNGANNLVNDVKDATIDGVHGVPRIASETRPVNIALLPCIKY